MPEPVSAALLVVGMTVVGVAARRRRLRRRPVAGHPRPVRDVGDRSGPGDSPTAILGNRHCETTTKE